MQIVEHFGTDTGMSLIDVLLESKAEAALSHREIWQRVEALLAAQDIPLEGVVDCFLKRRDEAGHWFDAGSLPWEAR